MMSSAGNLSKLTVSVFILLCLCLCVSVSVCRCVCVCVSTESKEIRLCRVKQAEKLQMSTLKLRFQSSFVSGSNLISFVNTFIYFKCIADILKSKGSFVNV